MTKAVRDALLEWISGMIVGAVPLLGHLAIWATAKRDAGAQGDWAVDFLFVAITASGMSVVSAMTRITKTLIPLPALSLALVLLFAINVVLIVPEAAIYGNIASGQARSGAFWTALMLLVASAFSAMIFELVIANRSEQSVASDA